MMRYENERLVLEIPAHTEEFDTIGLSTMLTYIARRNPEIIRQMEVRGSFDGNGAAGILPSHQP